MACVAVLGGDSRSTGWDESEAAELGGSAGGTETTSARTTMGPTNGHYADIGIRVIMPSAGLCRMV
jgi:hypothetical protein